MGDLLPTDSGQSRMIPGEWEPRTRARVGIPVTAAGPDAGSPAVARNADTSRVPPTASMARQSPARVRIVVGVGVLLAATLLAMWGAASAVW